VTKTTRLSNHLELRQRIFLMTRSARWVLWVLGLMLIAMFAVILILAFYHLPDSERSGAALLNTMLSKIVSDPVDAAMNALILIILVLHLVYMRLAQQHERLILTPTGIEYRSPLPEVLQPLRPSWSFAWSEIRTASLQGVTRARDARFVALELDNGVRKVKIFPFQWVDPAHYQPVSPMAGMWKLRREIPEEVVARVEESEVMRYISAVAPHLLPQRGAPFADLGFALAVVVAFFVFFLYALGDTFFVGHEVYADQPPYRFFIVTGILGAIAAALWLRRGQVPIAETLGVALLFGGALGVAAYPGALRVNAVTDAEGLHNYQYQLAQDMTLHPLSTELPTLTFPRYTDYWSHLKAGSMHEFELRRGGLGFYQVNMQPINMKMREFYEGKVTGAARAAD
jgi:hypothetical protein